MKAVDLCTGSAGRLRCGFVEDRRSSENVAGIWPRRCPPHPQRRSSRVGHSSVQARLPESGVEVVIRSMSDQSRLREYSCWESEALLVVEAGES